MTRAWPGRSSRRSGAPTPRAAREPKRREPPPFLPSARKLAFVLAIAVAAGGILRGGEETSPEHTESEIKAAFLFNFTKYVDWPADALPGAQAGFVLCDEGRDDFKGGLESMLRGRTVEGRALAWKIVRGAPAPGECQLLFVGREEGQRSAALLAALRKTPILTVGETEEFGSQGGIIWFTLSGNRVRFTINLDAARRAGLRISSRLLAVATVVDDAHAGVR